MRRYNNHKKVHLSDIHGGLVSDPAVALGQLNVLEQIIKHLLNKQYVMILVSCMCWVDQ